MVVLESVTCFNSSLLMARRELNCLTIQFSHLLSIPIIFPYGINLRDVKKPNTDKYHIFKEKMATILPGENQKGEIQLWQMEVVTIAGTVAVGEERSLMVRIFVVMDVGRYTRSLHHTGFPIFMSWRPRRVPCPWRWNGNTIFSTIPTLWSAFSSSMGRASK